VTDPQTPSGSAPPPAPVANGRRSLPPDPDKYDAARNVAARSRGLEAPYIAGGEDPEIAATLRKERRYVRLLVGMAIAIVLLGFVLGIISVIVGAILAG
jgi:hypothetical protein